MEKVSRTACKRQCIYEKGRICPKSDFFLVHFFGDLLVSAFPEEGVHMEENGMEYRATISLIPERMRMISTGLANRISLEAVQREASDSSSQQRKI